MELSLRGGDIKFLRALCKCLFGVHFCQVLSFRSRVEIAKHSGAGRREMSVT